MVGFHRPSTRTTPEARGAAGMWDQAMARWMNTPAGRTLFLPALALLVFAVCGATSSPFACVVGTGTAASCTEAALDACLPGGGTFDGTAIFYCGGVDCLRQPPSRKSSR